MQKYDKLKLFDKIFTLKKWLKFAKPFLEIWTGVSMYKTLLINTTRNAEKRTDEIERVANEQYDKGYKLVSAIGTPNFGVIMVFEKRDEK